MNIERKKSYFYGQTKEVLKQQQEEMWLLRKYRKKCFLQIVG